MDASPRSIYLTNCCVNHNANIQARDRSNRTARIFPTLGSGLKLNPYYVTDHHRNVRARHFP